MMSPCNEDHVAGQAIETPHDNDILSGRGNFVNYHPGNEQFRALVRKHKVAYVACPKSMKGTFAEMIVEEIKRMNPPGRFLKQDDATKLWYDIGEKKALDKTRQALREGAPEIQKEISGEEVAIPPLVTKIKETQRRNEDRSIPNVTSGIQLSQERRASDFATNPPYNFLSDQSGFAQTQCELYLPAPTLMQQQHQQHLTPVQTPVLSQVTHQDDSDPYCSSLPPELYEQPTTSMNQAMSANIHSIGSYDPALTMVSSD
jgi:hypothetical protein